MLGANSFGDFVVLLSPFRHVIHRRQGLRHKLKVLNPIALFLATTLNSEYCLEAKNDADGFIIFHTI